MRKKILETVVQLGTFCSLVGLLFSIRPDWYAAGSPLSWVFFIASVALCVLLVTWIWAEEHTTREFSKSSQRWAEEVRDYMSGLLQNNSKTVIVWNDLSWGDPKILQVMKGKGAELTVFVARVTSTVAEMKQAGVLLFDYSAIVAGPLESRFTVVNVGALQEETSVGYGDGKAQRIDRCRRGSPEHHLAMDLVRILTRLAKPI